jgi:hypothetical protein
MWFGCTPSIAYFCDMRVANIYRTISKLGLILCFMLNVSASSAQSDAHPILDRMDLYVAAGKVYVTCIVSAGYTCFGIELKRSVDSLNYETVDIEYGICGSDSEPTFFSFVDDSPPLNQLLYYRLDLGGFGYTKVIEARVVDVQEFGYRITPNPASDFAEIHFSNINKSPVLVSVFDLHGNAVAQVRTITDVVKLDLSTFESGLYLIVIENEIERKVVKGKIVIAK